MHSQTASKNTPTSCMTFSGIYFDPYDPDPSLVRLFDIGHALDAMPRFGGHVRSPITVGSHVHRTKRLARAIAPEGLEDDCEFLALHHEDHEAYSPWGDCLGPGKTAWMRDVEHNIQAAIWSALGWSPTPEVEAVVKRADLLALFYEATLWQPCGHDWTPGLIDVAQPDMVRDLPLVMPREGEMYYSSASNLRKRTPKAMASIWLWPKSR